jgi:hypothetical protein
MVVMTKTKSPFMEIINQECKKDGKGRFKTMDVLRVAQRLHTEQQEIITALKQHLNSITRK